MEFTGIVQSIIYRNPDNGYTVLNVQSDKGEQLTAVGALMLVGEGEQVLLKGDIKSHPRFGRQLAVTSYERIAPRTASAVIAYLGSGVVKGVGPALAKTIVDQFGLDTLRIMEEEPDRLCEVRGIGHKKSAMICESFRENYKMREILMALEPYGVTVNQAYRLYKTYGDLCLAKVQENPYRMIEDVEGIGFLTADKIAQNVAGFEFDSRSRLEAGLRFALTDAMQEYGHTYLPREKLLIKAQGLLGVGEEALQEAIDNMADDGRLLIQYPDGDTDCVFLPYLARMEDSIAAHLFALREAPSTQELWDLGKYEKELGLTLSDEQRSAVKAALNAGLIVITGGPGTGKTTIIRVIVRALFERQLSVGLAAPTGRAAKRMTEATGFDAATIHRLLEYNPSEGFVRNRDKQLDFDAIVIDEMSMVDAPLMYALLQAVPQGTRLILVGDRDQLPPVGCGDVLKDVIESGAVQVIRLTEIFRQAQQSAIVMNAHRINNGQMPDLSPTHNDFVFEELLSPDAVLNRILSLFAREKSALGSSEPLMDVQVLTPMKKGTLGVYNLNMNLQATLNPPSPLKEEHSFGSTTFREGDKIMQIKNDYKVEWTKQQQDGTLQDGTGAFNGDLGTLYRVNERERTLTVLFDDNRMANYDFAQADELDLAYCISIHKSQGSEFRTVLLPLAGGPPMLLTRNLLYTAVTRARELVFCVGRRETIAQMVHTCMTRRRYTSLAQRLKARLTETE